MNDTVRAYINGEIERKHLPGAVLYVSHKGNVICEEAFGYRTVYPTEEAMTTDTIFDLASLTKVVATLPSIVKLIEFGEIELTNPVSNYLPSFKEDKITIFNLLTHTSGLPAHRQYHIQSLSVDEIVEEICNEKLEAPVGKQIIYSDLGLILLYKIIEKIVGEKFEDFARKEIFAPLEMELTTFNPTYPKEWFAATEFCKLRSEYKRGIVHDENAETMSGVSGHAGLFSTVQDVAKFASMIENDGIYNEKRILSKALIDQTRENYTPFDKEYRGLGWMLQNHRGSSCGDLFSGRSYGHTGFTGTSIWFDPAISLHVILLTNRVHFGRTDHILRIRPRIHNLIRSQFV
jgi:CubicO group peptidase (beta-lactamase class C family)